MTSTDLAAIAKLPTQSRGRAFENFIRELFEEHGLKGQPRSNAAKPHQVDLVARIGRYDVLVEAKWQTRPVGRPEIGELRLRLQEARAGFVGCFFSMSEFAKPGVEDVESHRTHDIVLFGPSDVRDLASGKANLLAMFREKLATLRMDHVARTGARRPVVSMPRPVPRKITLEGGKPVQWIALGGVRGPCMAPDGLWVDAVPCGLELTPTPRNAFEGADGLTRLLARLRRTHGITGDGAFTIRDSDESWFGFGAKQAVAALRAWRSRRIDSKSEYPAQSEELLYVDQIDGGLVFVSGSHRFGGSVRRLDLGVAFALPGVPVDTAPYRTICKELGARAASFDASPDAGPFHATFPQIPLDVIGLVYGGREKSVVGVVARNPFGAGSDLPKARGTDKDVLSSLTSGAPLVCSLSDWHDADRVERYVLTGVRGVQTPVGPVFDAIATWV